MLIINKIYLKKRNWWLLFCRISMTCWISWIEIEKNIARSYAVYLKINILRTEKSRILILSKQTRRFIKKIENRVLHLLALLRFITAAIDQRFDRRDMKNKWIIVIFILCFIYKSRTCVRWSIMWNIQLHVNEIKRRVIECLFHIDLTIEYKSILNFFRELTQFQQTNLKLLNVEKKFIIIWDNFEQIKTMKH
jgi:hypothetical protein